MPRLIDATRIEQYILNNCSDNEEINAIYAEIINAPTVDAEPVVRCKDCKWFRFNKTAIWCDNERGLVEPRCDSFCSWGERKDE